MKVLVDKNVREVERNIDTIRDVVEILSENRESTLYIVSSEDFRKMQEKAKEIYEHYLDILRDPYEWIDDFKFIAAYTVDKEEYEIPECSYKKCCIE